jgi:hypothetical protein
MAKKWIAGAIKHPGALTKKAKAAGMSPMAYARKMKGAKGTTGKQARLALILQSLPKPSAAARRRGGKKAAATRARRRR